MKIIKNALIDVSLTILYIAFASFFMTNQDKVMGNEAISIMTMLLFLVISVAMMGILIFGKPIFWYLEGKKKEAASLLLYTVGFLFVILAVVVLFLNLSIFNL